MKGHRHQSDLKMSGAYAEKISLSSAISASENEADEGDGPNKGGSMGYQQVGSLTQNYSCRLRSGHLLNSILLTLQNQGSV